MSKIVVDVLCIVLVGLTCYNFYRMWMACGELKALRWIFEVIEKRRSEAADDDDQDANGRGEE